MFIFLLNLEVGLFYLFQRNIFNVDFCNMFYRSYFVLTDLTRKSIRETKLWVNLKP